jgi:hypothetical protein
MAIHLLAPSLTKIGGGGQPIHPWSYDHFETKQEFVTRITKISQKSRMMNHPENGEIRSLTLG